jgi:hypothetical protein
MPSATTATRDAAYIAIGLSVLGFQKLQVRRRELAQRYPQAHATVQSTLEQQLDAVEALADRIEYPIVARAGTVLPATAANAVSQVHAAGKSARRSVRSALII